MSDRKIEYNNQDYYTADVVSYSDYSPYGTLLDGRHGNETSYRYGFQGQEADDEIKGEGNSYNYTYRMHDPRIGRFFAVDPLTAKYAYYTPYSFSGNEVIHTVELEGLEPESSLLTPANVGKTYPAQDRISEKENDVFNYKIEGNSNGQWFVKMDQITGPTVGEAARIANEVYNIDVDGIDPGTDESKIGDWELQKEYFQGNFKAGLYRKEIDGVYFYTLAFAGTDDLPDGVEDVTQLTGSRYIPSYHLALMVANKVDKFMGTLDKGNELTFVGHSLGAGLAAAASRKTGHDAITFNAAAISSTTKQRLGIVDSKSVINNYVIKGEIVTYGQSLIGMKAEGTTHWLKSPTSIGDVGYTQGQELLIPMKIKVHDHGMVQVIKALENRGIK